MLKQSVLILLILSFSSSGFSQNPADSLSKKEIRKARPRYTLVGSGANWVAYRDFATSSLFYRGVANTFYFASIRKDEKREAQYGATSTVAGGTILDLPGLSATVDEAEVGTSRLQNLNIFYTQLYQIPKFQKAKWNIKAGGSLMSNWSLRRNEAFQNNSFGLENVTTLFASMKVNRDISRKEAIEKKFLFIKYKRKPKKQFLSFQLNLATVNTTFRNGFIYNNALQSVAVNEPKAFAGYEFNIFSGYRINSLLERKTYFKNGNAISLAYQWDAFTTGNRFDKFEMAQHSFDIILYFREN